MTLPLSLFQRSKSALLTAALATLSPALAATPAGTVITNQAVANFAPLQPGGVTESESNVVTTTVQAVCAVSVTGLDGLQRSALGGDQVTFRLKVVNAGNERKSLPLNLQATGDFAAQPTLYLDSNGNGQVDSGELPVTQLDLDPDAAASLLLVVGVPETAQGELGLSLVTSCGGSVAASVRVAPPPELRIAKSFEPAQMRPGQETTVTVTVDNPANYEGRDVVLTDLLTEQIAQGLTYVPGSARASQGVLEYTSDGQSWSAQPGAAVAGLRVRAERLGGMERLTLTFRMVGQESADGKTFTNNATVQTPARTIGTSARVDVRYRPGVAIGPVGRPLAAEDSPEDRQTRTFAVVGGQVCFDHTVQNTGDVADNFRFTVTFPQGNAEASFYGEGGQPLVQPLRLNPDQTALVRVCYAPSAAGALHALLRVTGDRGTTNTTHDLVSQIAAGLPELKKSAVATTTDADGKPLTLAPGKTVATGDTITYTLEVYNPYNITLSDVVVSDPIPAHLDFVSATEGGKLSGEVDNQQVTWAIASLAPGERRTFSFVTRVSARAIDGENLKNIFQMVSTELPQPTSSNEVSTPVWSAKLLIEKQVSAQEVTYGERLTYTLRIRNTSETTPVVDAIITDTPARGLEYIPGTSMLGGEALADPTILGESLQWKVGSIPPKGEIVITYDARVTPEATASLTNTVIVEGKGGDAARAIASNRALAVTKLNPLKFAAITDILGTVFVDRNRNGLYDKGIDTPVERARVLLAGGRQVLTDKMGRYKFSNVPFGTQALRLDPTTTPYPPLHLPQDGGLSGTRTVHLRGLTTVDFPLSPLAGEIAELRRTTLKMGDLTVQKVVYAQPGSQSYVVQLKLNTPRALEDFDLTDPLPTGAILKEGRNTLQAKLEAGETNLTYRFEWAGEPRAVTTDPVVRWRY
ncbi:DUF11 domain-containing protein [Deinococcus sp. VB142]|uniref:DUF11 domain-containing protein n=1 Tax=Deinococcus sp. VB142 TaxID=3112952 RepID=A0AAU6Q0C5_9DEIO